MNRFKKVIRKFKKSIDRTCRNVVQKYTIRPYMKERLCRREFFYNAFTTLKFNGIDGDYVEFGSHSAQTFAQAYHEIVRRSHSAKLWAFDSFQGLPESNNKKDLHPRWVAKTMETSLDKFHKACASRGIPKDAYNVVPGYYNKSLPDISKKDEPNNIALAYIDCDLYSSTKNVLEFLEPRLKHGMIIASDDYFCYSKDQMSGERLAMLEQFSGNNRWQLCPYMQFGWHGNFFIIEDKKNLAISHSR